ncbi:hypothetical protein H6F77_05750, partial [Microcoleus sp. FACHB-831]|uniref:hypothetical protein n=1 Tax=Microcoleus sp. FACHB-831 TaxID=2692827 RepID=UPI001686C6A9
MKNPRKPRQGRQSLNLVRLTASLVTGLALAGSIHSASAGVKKSTPAIANTTALSLPAASQEKTTLEVPQPQEAQTIAQLQISKTQYLQGVTTRLKRLLDKGYSSHAPLIKRLFIANGSEHCLDP